MKQSIFRRYPIPILVMLITVQFTIFNSAYARTPQPQSTGGQTEYAPEELELVRSKMLELVDATKEVAGLLPDNYGLEELEKARIQIEQFSSKELTMFRRGLDRSQIDWNRVAKARQTLIDYKSNEAARQKSIAKENAKGAFSVTSEGFPNSSPVCQRVTTEAMIATNALYLAAVLAKDIARDTCNQVIVALGEGGNTSLACIPFDTVFNINEAVYYAIRICFDQFIDTTVDTNYQRLDHIHTDLENTVANDNTNAANIIANANTNASNITTNANSNKAAIIANDNTNTTTITNAIASAVTTLSNSSGSTQNQLRDLLLNTQIESELARDSSSVPVAMYELPASAGGLLDKVRSVVAQTITNVLAAGGSVANAQSFLATGDQYKAAGQFKSAFDNYRRAYQAAAR